MRKMIESDHGERLSWEKKNEKTEPEESTDISRFRKPYYCYNRLNMEENFLYVIWSIEF